MRRVAEWALYLVGALGVIYLLLYVYTILTQPNFAPGDPIRIFRKPDAPNYSDGSNGHSARRTSNVAVPTLSL